MHVNKLLVTTGIAFLVLAGPWQPAQAAIVAYHDFASFSAALVDQSVIQETYESEEPNTVVPDGGTLNGLTYDFPTDLEGRIDGTFANLGSQAMAAERDGVPGAEPDGFDFFFPGDSITITLPVFTRAIGVYISSAVAGSMNYSISVAGQGSVATNGVYDPGVFPPAQFYFVGLTSDTPFNQATIGANSMAMGGYTFDDVTFVVPKAGDVNGDGTVNIFDINLVSSHWGESGPVGDANFDMAVNIFDINLISANWTPGGGVAVPEPASANLLTVGLLCMGAAMAFTFAKRPRSAHRS